MQREYVRRTARNSRDEYGVYAVSVFLVIEGTVEEVCAGQPNLARYGRVRLSTAGRVRSAGFRPIATLARPHYDVVLPDVGDGTLARLEAAFDPPIPNPGRRPRLESP